MNNATGGVVLIMLGVLGLYLIWKTEVVDRIVGGSRGLLEPQPLGKTG